jgi:hypothetical protein
MNVPKKGIFVPIELRGLQVRNLPKTRLGKFSPPTQLSIFKEDFN